MLFSNVVRLRYRNAVLVDGLLLMRTALIVLLALSQYCHSGLNLFVFLCKCGLALLEMFFENADLDIELIRLGVIRWYERQLVGRVSLIGQNWLMICCGT